MPLGLGSVTAVEAETIQPTWSASGLYLELGDTVPVVRRPNGLRSPVPLRSGESISGFTELATGWLATGIQPSRPRGKRTARGAASSDGAVPGRDGSDLLVVAGGDGPIRRLPNPRGSGARIRAAATPVVADGELVGLVWLEGDEQRSLSVMSADWTGFSWGPAVRVSAAGPGSQIAPTAVVGHDGAWMAAWSRFDGRDDEIYWSRRSGANWTQPVRAHARHAGPDIKPSLTVHGDEILLAWSRYDSGDYRAVLARWSNGRWLAPSSIAAQSTAFPTFTQKDGETYLLYQELAPAGWTLAEISPAGAILRRAGARAEALPATVGNTRPVVSQVGAAAPTLSWPGLGAEVSPLWEVQP